MAEQDALSGGNFGSDLFLSEFPAKFRVLTVDPLVYRDSFGNTKYSFIVYNTDKEKPQILDKGPGFAQRFKEIHLDPDFGSNIRGIDVKVTTNGKQGKEIRYTIVGLGAPYQLTNDQIKEAAKIDLEAVIKKKNPSALRLSEINSGAKLPDAPDETPPEPSFDPATANPAIEDMGGEPINLDDIPF